MRKEALMDEVVVVGAMRLALADSETLIRLAVLTAALSFVVEGGSSSSDDITMTDGEEEDLRLMEGTGALIDDGPGTFEGASLLAGRGLEP
jgi:hypothetical protein